MMSYFLCYIFMYAHFQLFYLTGVSHMVFFTDLLTPQYFLRNANK